MGIIDSIAVPVVCRSADIIIKLARYVIDYHHELVVLENKAERNTVVGVVHVFEISSPPREILLSRKVYSESGAESVIIALEKGSIHKKQPFFTESEIFHGLSFGSIFF